jgi:hypothetical protein
MTASIACVSRRKTSRLGISAASFVMTAELALAIYFAEHDAVVKHRCDLDARLRAARQAIETLRHKIAPLSKSSSNSSSRTS